MQKENQGTAEGLYRFGLERCGRKDWQNAAYCLEAAIALDPANHEDATAGIEALATGGGDSIVRQLFPHRNWWGELSAFDFLAAMSFAQIRGEVVTPLSVVDLPESYKNALTDVTGTFRVGFQPFHCPWKLSGHALSSLATANGQAETTVAD